MSKQNIWSILRLLNKVEPLLRHGMFGASDMKGRYHKLYIGYSNGFYKASGI